MLSPRGPGGSEPQLTISGSRLLTWPVLVYSSFPSHVPTSLSTLPEITSHLLQTPTSGSDCGEPTAGNKEVV